MIAAGLMNISFKFVCFRILFILGHILFVWDSDVPLIFVTFNIIQRGSKSPKSSNFPPE